MADYARVTLTDIQGFLLSRVGGNSAFWPSAALLDAINHSLRVWQALTGEWVITTSTITATGAHFYDVPSTDYAPYRITHSFSGEPLTFTSLEELDMEFPSWDTTATGDPLYWAHVGATKIAVHPAAASGTFSLESIQDTPTLSVGADFVQMGDEDLQKVLAYAHHVLTFKEGISEMEATKGALLGLIEAAGRRNAAIRLTNFYRSVGRGKISIAPTQTLGVRGG